MIGNQNIREVGQKGERKTSSILNSSYLLYRVLILRLVVFYDQREHDFAPLMLMGLFIFSNEVNEKLWKRPRNQAFCYQMDGNHPNTGVKPYI